LGVRIGVRKDWFARKKKRRKIYFSGRGTQMNDLKKGGRIN